MNVAPTLPHCVSEGESAGRPSARSADFAALAARRRPDYRRHSQVFLLTVMVGNLAEKSLAFSAMPTATRRAIAL